MNYISINNLNEISSVTKGSVLTTTGDELVVIRLSDKSRKSISKIKLISESYKYRNEILSKVASYIDDENTIFIDAEAEHIIDALCAANCLLF